MRFSVIELLLILFFTIVKSIVKSSVKYKIDNNSKTKNHTKDHTGHGFIAIHLLIVFVKIVNFGTNNYFHTFAMTKSWLLV